MTVATGLGATVDVAHEASVRRVGPRPDTADLRVVLGVSLQLAILAGRAGPGLTAARAAALAACADVAVTLRADARGSLIDRAGVLREARPNAVLVVAEPGDDDGLLELAEALRLACATQQPQPMVLLAGDLRTRDRLLGALGGLPTEAMAHPASSAGHDAIVARLRGLRRGGTEVVLRDEAIEAACRAAASATGRSTLIVDVSGSTTSLAWTSGSGAVSGVHVRVGVGANADRIVRGTGLERVRRWLPRAIDAPALLERVFNRARWPDAVASSTVTLAIEMSLAREAIGTALREAERAGLAVPRGAQHIICTGDLARLPRPSQTLLVAIDAIGPDGTQLIARERADALVAAGAIASRSKVDAFGAIEPVALVLTMAPRRSTTVRISDGSGVIEERIARGGFLLVPTTGAVEVQLPGMTAPATANALALGVVIDARGRPLEIPPRDAERLPTLARWHGALDALPPDGAER